MNLNLKHKDEEKVHIGCKIYMSDKAILDKIADDMGISTTLLLRSIINDLIDSHQKSSTEATNTNKEKAK